MQELRINKHHQVSPRLQFDRNRISNIRQQIRVRLTGVKPLQRPYAHDPA